MKYKNFDFGLFKQSLKQLAPTAVITILFSAIYMYYRITNEYSLYLSYGDALNYYDNSYIDFPAVLTIALALILPVITFNFMNKQNSSDYYYSLPQRRICLFLSLNAGVLTWLLCMCATLFLVPYSFLCKYPKNPIIAENLQDLCNDIIPVILLALFVYVSTLIAISVTGTLFSRITIALVLTAAPSLLCYVVKTTAEALFMIIPTNQLLPCYIIQLDIISFFDNPITLLSVCLSELLLIIGAVIAAILFNIRPANTCNNLFSHNIVLVIFQIIVGVLLGTSGTSCIYLASHKVSTDYSTPYGIFLYMAALLMVLLIEFICKKNLKSAKKLLPALLAIILLNVATFGAIKALLNFHLNHKLTTGNIDNYKIQNSSISETKLDEYIDYKDSLYFDNNKSMIVEMYNYTASLKKKAFETNDYSILNDKESLSFYMSVNSKKLNCQMYATSDMIADLRYSMYTSDSIKKLLENVPDYNDMKKQPHIRISVTSNHTREQLENIYKTFVTEYNALSYDKKIELMNNTESEITVTWLLEKVGVSYDLMKIYLIPDIMPKTYDYVFSSTKDAQIKTINELINDNKDSDNNNLRLDIYNTKSHISNFRSADAISFLEELKDEDFSFSTNKNIYSISIRTTSPDKTTTYTQLLICTDKEYKPK